MFPVLRVRTAALFVAAATLAGCSHTAPWHLKNITHVVPPLKFRMQRVPAGPVTAEDFRGKVVLLYFGYTHCPDVCPTTLAKIRSVMKHLGPVADSVRLLFVTVDPKRDTPEVLARYVHAFDPRFVGLRGTEDQLAALAKRYRVSFSAQKPDKDGNYSVSHSSAIFVFDRHGDARLLADQGTSVADYVADLKRLAGGA